MRSSPRNLCRYKHECQLVREVAIHIPFDVGLSSASSKPITQRMFSHRPSDTVENMSQSSRDACSSGTSGAGSVTRPGRQPTTTSSQRAPSEDTSNTTSTRLSLTLPNNLCDTMRGERRAIATDVPVLVGDAIRSHASEHISSGHGDWNERCEERDNCKKTQNKRNHAMHSQNRQRDRLARKAIHRPQAKPHTLHCPRNVVVIKP